MKKLKFLLIGAISLLATSCLVDDEDSTNAQGLYGSPNIANFVENKLDLILTPSDGVKEYSTRVNYITDLPISNIGSSFKFEVNTAETTVPAAGYEILTSPDFTFDIAAGEEVAEGYFEYKIIPDGVTVGEIQYLVIDLIKVNGPIGAVGGKLIISMDKCDPPYIGSYTTANSVGFFGDGEEVIISADCNGNYQGSNIPAFNGQFSFDFTINTDGSLNIDPNGSPVLPLISPTATISGSGSILPSGTIQFTQFDIDEAGLTGYSFDLIPN